MEKQNNRAPHVTTHAPPNFEIYQVAEHELEKIESEAKHVGVAATAMWSSISICVASIITLMTCDTEHELVLKVVAAAFGLIAVGLGIFSFIFRKIKIIAEIRNRREEPKA